MKVADKVILLLNDADALAAAVSGSLIPDPESDFRTLKEYFRFPLESYGIKDQKASGEIINFIDSNGNYEVSVLLLQKYEPPILACALNEVLLQLGGHHLSTVPTLIVPVVVSESKLKQENKYPRKNDKASVYGIKLGPTTDLTEALSSKFQKSPPLSQIYLEELAVLLHLVNVIKLPTVVLIGVSDQRISNKNSEEELEVICEIGEHLASVSSLIFSKEKMVRNPSKILRDSGEAWRALYG